MVVLSVFQENIQASVVLCHSFIYRHLSDYTDFLPLAPVSLASGRIFRCEVQSSAVDAENFWDENRTAAVVPVAGIFLYPLSKAYSCQKVCVIGGRLILHRKITS